MALNKFDSRKALKIKESYYTPLEKKVFRIFFDILYRPIFELIKKNIGTAWLVKENSKKGKLSLIQAIRAGKVQYTGKDFEGTFNAVISKEIKEMGGKWNKNFKRWHISPNKLSYDVKVAIAEADMKTKALNGQITAYLDALEDKLSGNDTDYDLTQDFGNIVMDLDSLFYAGIKNIAIAPELTPEMVELLKKEWSENMNLYIKGWTEESIKRLRKRVWDNVMNGYRSKDLIAEIKHDYNVSYNKAKFLARQETSLLMSKFREARYKSAGIERYRWSTAGDSRVRDSHKKLNGRIFDWEHPPFETGNRHPGEDYNCRCVAIPIID